MTYEEKKKGLLNWMEENTRKGCVIAFSGGVDSSVLLKLACNLARESGASVHAVTIHSDLQPIGDLEIAKRVAKETGAIHHVIETDELNEAGIGNNPEDRCYLCKKYLFSQLMDLSRELKIAAVMEGTNEDDLHVYRPGIRAIRELHVSSPLADHMFTKAEVRRLAKELGVSVADRPSAPCLATRFPYGTRLSMEEMKRVESGEVFLRELGFGNVRLRIHGDLVRIEVEKEKLALALERKEEIVKHLTESGYRYVTLDLEGFRSGSMDSQ